MRCGAVVPWWIDEQGRFWTPAALDKMNEHYAAIPSRRRGADRSRPRDPFSDDLPRAHAPRRRCGIGLAAGLAPGGRGAKRRSAGLLATAQEICFARAGAYQSDVVQLEPASLARMSCPVSERPYVLRSDGVSYAVLCPPPESHGAIHDGVVSWESAR